MADPGSQGDADDTLVDRDAAGSRPMSGRATVILGLYLIVCFTVLVGLLVSFWPVTGTDGKKWDQAVTILGCSTEIFGCPAGRVSDDVRLIILVTVAGALGAMVHAIRSFAAFLGNRRLFAGWGWWYILRPFEGAALALAFYLLLRGGLINTGGNSDAPTGQIISVFGFCGASVLVGMFSQEAIEKLKQVAEVFFSKVQPQKDPLVSAQGVAAPRITKLDPGTLAVQATNLTVTVTGEGFSARSEGRVNGSGRATRFVSEQSLTITLDAADVGIPGQLKVTVFNPPPNGGESEVVTLTVQ